MSKGKISLIILAVFAVIAVFCVTIHLLQKKPVQSLTAVKPVQTGSKKDSVESAVAPAAKQTDSINLTISAFQKKPSLATLNVVENSIRQQLPSLSIEQRYALLEQWEKALTPMISRLDPEQKKVLTIYDNLAGSSYVDSESAADYGKRMDRELPEKLTFYQKTLYKQLTDHQIQITQAEEVGSVYKLKPAYWKDLFASSLTESDQKYWNQRAFENDPVVDYDAGLAVDRVTLGDWAFSWEQYLKKYPKSHYQNHAESIYQSYMCDLLVGLENTPTLDSETNKIVPEVETDFDTIIKRHPNSSVSNAITLFRKKIQEVEGKTNISTKLYDIANTIVKQTK
ncbi:hypothetical protein H7F33_03685 [Pedobacter sp. PAMC26386]|nr:hypothetical protein H7F33_03685 [Pedobacter sp. PAMC26386]